MGTILGYMISTILDMLLATVFITEAGKGNSTASAFAAVASYFIWITYIVGISIYVAIDVNWACMHKKFFQIIKEKEPPQK